MTNEMKYLMYLYACAAKSVSADSPKYSVDFKKLYSLADQMSLLSTLSYALKISPNVQCPNEIKNKLYTIMLGTSLKNKMRIDAVLKLLGDIEKQGIKAVVMKGLDCARFYTKPECRISADTDLLVDEKDEERLLKYLEQKGYIVKRRKKHQHHSECENAQTGMIEVHTKIWEDFVYDAMIKKMKKIRNCTENSVVVPVNNTQMRVLQQTDAMIFMTLHLVKHFMFSCANLKMSYDLALYYVNNKDLVDSKKYRAWVRESGYETIVSAIFSAMTLYCGFEKEEFQEITYFDEQKGESFADCISRYDSSKNDDTPNPFVMVQYCTVAGDISKNGKAYAFLRNAQKVIETKFRTLFPKMSHMKLSYSYLHKHPYLYLVACTHRFFDRGTKYVFHDDPKNGKLINYRENLDSQITEKEKKRIEVLQEMKLL